MEEHKPNKKTLFKVDKSFSSLPNNPHLQPRAPKRTQIPSVSNYTNINHDHPPFHNNNTNTNQLIPTPNIIPTPKQQEYSNKINVTNRNMSNARPQYQPHNNNNIIPTRTQSQLSSTRLPTFHSSKEEEQYLTGSYTDYLRNAEETNGKTFAKYMEEFPEWESYESILIKVSCIFNDNFRSDNCYIFLYLYGLPKNFPSNTNINANKTNNIHFHQSTPCNYNDKHLREECHQFYLYKQKKVYEITHKTKDISHCYDMLKITSKIYHKINGLTEIDLTSYDFNSDLIQLVISAVKFNGTVQKLILTGNLLGEEGCYWLGMMLRNNTTVNDVDLTRCGITNTCLKMINEGLRSSKHNNSNHSHKVNTFHLEKLRLSENKITSEGATELANLLENFSYLKWLNITKNTLCNEGFKTLLLKYEELLQMKSSHSTSLETLIAINNQIKEEDSLEVLARIVENPNCKLKTLILSENNISCNSAHCSSGYLSKFFHSMKKNNSIVELLLLNCNIGNYDVDNICSMLQENKTLEILNLYCNHVDDPEKFLQLLGMFSNVNGQCCNGLKQFDLSKNDCKLDKSEFFDQFLKVLEGIRLTSLDISQNFDLKNLPQDYDIKFKNVTEQLQKTTKIVF